MPRLGCAFLFALLASPALAAPKNNFKHRHLHRRRDYLASGVPDSTGTGGPYGYANGTNIGPTGTGTSGPIVVSTISVSPVPLPIETGCGANFVTVTQTSTLTVTAEDVSSLNAALGAVSSTSINGADIGSVVIKAAIQTGTGVSEPLYGTVSAGIPGNGSFATSVVPDRSSSSRHRHPKQATRAPKSSSGFTTSTATIVSTPVSISSPAAAVLPSSLSSSSSAPDLAQGVSQSDSAAAQAPEPSSSTISVAPLAPSSSSAAVPALPPVSSAPAYSAPASSLTTSAAQAPTTPSVPINAAVASSSAAAIGSPVIKNTAARSYAGGPRGLVGELSSAKLFAGSKCSWAYNWDSAPSGLPAGIEFVPMLWSNDADHTAHFHDNAAAAIASGSSAIMGFNEPDKPRSQGGSAIDAYSAARDYITHLHPFIGKARIGAPAVAAGNLRWMDDWVSACKSLGDCHYDFIPIHWYGDASGSGATQAGWMKDYIRTVQGHFPGAKIWLTEFSAIPIADQGVNKAFLDAILPWLDDAANGVERYSFFMLAEGNLVRGGQLSGTGKEYF